MKKYSDYREIVTSGHGGDIQIATMTFSVEESSKKFYKVKDVAKILSVNPKTIYDYIKKGKLKSVKLGGGIRRIEDTELEKFIDKYR